MQVDTNKDVSDDCYDNNDDVNYEIDVIMTIYHYNLLSMKVLILGL